MMIATAPTAYVPPSLREQIARIVARWRRELPEGEVVARAQRLRAAILDDMARYGGPANEGQEMLEALAAACDAGQEVR